MRVKLLAIMAGPAGTHDIGEEIEVSDELGRLLLEGGYAAPLSLPPEAATAELPAESATLPPSSRRRRP